MTTTNEIRKRKKNTFLPHDQLISFVIIKAVLDFSISKGQQHFVIDRVHWQIV